MPGEIWGYHLGDHVEVRSSFGDPWEPGVVQRFTPHRTLRVHTDAGGMTDVSLPVHIRPWKRPTTPEEIERYLSG